MSEKQITKNPEKLTLPFLDEDVSDVTGEQVRIPRLEVPEIRVSYKAADDPDKVVDKGEFIEYNPLTKKTKALGKKVSGIQILHHRQQVSLTTDTDSYRGFEINMKKKEYQLFLFTKDQSGKTKTEFIGSGTLDSLRSLSAILGKLRYERCLYILHEGVLKKLNVYGASFSQFIEFNKMIRGQSSTSVQIDLTTGKEKKGINIYHPIIFTPREKSDLPALKPLMVQLADWFAKYDGLIAKQQAERQDQAANDRGDKTPHLSSTEPRDYNGARNTGRTLAEEIQHPDEERRATEKEMEENLGF